MKKFEAPAFVELNESLENVYTASGEVPGTTDSTPIIPGGGGGGGTGGTIYGDSGDPRWSLITKQWDHHNTGHLSVLRIILLNTDGSKTQNLKCLITFGLPILSWSGLNGSGGSFDVQQLNDYTLQVIHYANYVNSENKVEISFSDMRFQHDSSEKCQDGANLTAYSRPIDGQSGPYPAGNDYIVTWSCSDM